MMRQSINWVIVSLLVSMIWRVTWKISVQKKKRQRIDDILYLAGILRWAPMCEDRALVGQCGNRGRNDCAPTPVQSDRLMKILSSPFDCVRFVSLSCTSRVFSLYILENQEMQESSQNSYRCRLVRVECVLTVSHPFYLSLLFTQSRACYEPENTHTVLGEYVSLGSGRGYESHGHSKRWA